MRSSLFQLHHLDTAQQGLRVKSRTNLGSEKPGVAELQLDFILSYVSQLRWSSLSDLLKYFYWLLRWRALNRTIIIECLRIKIFGMDKCKLGIFRSRDQHNNTLRMLYLSVMTQSDMLLFRDFPKAYTQSISVWNPTLSIGASHRISSQRDGVPKIVRLSQAAAVAHGSASIFCTVTLVTHCVSLHISQSTPTGGLHTELSHTLLTTNTWLFHDS